MRRLAGLAAAAAATLAALRALAAVQQWPFLTEWLTLPPWYFVLSGTLGAVSGWAVALGLWRRWEWAGLGLALWVGAGLALWWFERLALSPLPGPPRNWPFALGLSLVTLAITIWTTRQLRRDPAR